jgi:hypothetical protein
MKHKKGFLYVLSEDAITNLMELELKDLGENTQIKKAIK